MSGEKEGFFSLPLAPGVCTAEVSLGFGGCEQLDLLAVPTPGAVSQAMS
jgi:hypothetical protein